MKTLNTAEIVQTSGAQESKKISIAANSKAFKELISGIYSDKAFAVTRELFANAVDAQTEAGCGDRPFLVIAPNVLEPTFSVRDYGVSMTHDLVMNLYSQLFVSTKDDPNSDESNKFTGKFGLGSKTPFAYTDAFQLTTYLDGKMRGYDIFMSGGEPEISLFVSQDTDEENGVMVSFPVEKGDFEDFHRAIKQAMEGLDVQPTIKGAKIEYIEPETVMSGDNWKLYVQDNYSTSHVMRVRQGTVVYPLNSTAIPNLPQHLNYLFRLNIRFDVPIGTLEMNTSREALSYDDYTCGNLIKHLEEIDADLTAQIADNFKDVKTYAEFCNLYREVQNKFHRTLFDNCVKGLTFKGREFAGTVYFIDRSFKKTVQAVDEEGNLLFVDEEKTKPLMRTTHIHKNNAEFCHYSASDLRTLTATYFRKDRGAYAINSHGYIGDRYSFTSGKKLVIALETTHEKLSMATARFRKATNDLSGQDVLWMRTSDADPMKTITRIWLELGRPELEVIDLSKVELTKVDRVSFEVLKTPEFKVRNSRDTGFERPNSADPVPVKAVYVDLYRDDVQTQRDFNTLRTAYKCLVERKIIEDLPLLGIPASQKYRLKRQPEWVSFEDVVMENVVNLIDIEQLKSDLWNRLDNELPDFNIGALEYLIEYTADINFSKKKTVDNKNIIAGRVWQSKNGAKQSTVWEVFSTFRELRQRISKKRYDAGQNIRKSMSLIDDTILQDVIADEYKVFDAKRESIRSMIDRFNEEFPLWKCFEICTWRDIEHVNDIRDYMKLN